MKKIKSLLIYILLFSMTSYSQNHSGIEEKFIRLLNLHEKDSLEGLLTDDFVLERTFTSYRNDKASFLDYYVPFSKEVNGKFKVLKVLQEGDKKQFLTQDYSDYFHYLNIDSPYWKITITVVNNMVSKLLIDSTSSTKKYLTEIELKDKAFKNWLEKNYPDENKFPMFKTEGLILKRLKEYAEKK